MVYQKNCVSKKLCIKNECVIARKLFRWYLDAGAHTFCTFFYLSLSRVEWFVWLTCVYSAALWTKIVVAVKLQIAEKRELNLHW